MRSCVFKHQEYATNNDCLYQEYNTSLCPLGRVAFKSVLNSVFALTNLETRFKYVLINSVHNGSLFNDQSRHFLVDFLQIIDLLDNEGYLLVPVSQVDVVFIVIHAQQFLSFLLLDLFLMFLPGQFSLFLWIFILNHSVNVLFFDILQLLLMSSQLLTICLLYVLDYLQLDV